MIPKYTEDKNIIDIKRYHLIPQSESIVIYLTALFLHQRYLCSYIISSLQATRSAKCATIFKNAG